MQNDFDNERWSIRPGGKLLVAGPTLVVAEEGLGRIYEQTTMTMTMKRMRMRVGMTGHDYDNIKKKPWCEQTDSRGAA